MNIFVTPAHIFVLLPKFIKLVCILASFVHFPRSSIDDRRSHTIKPKNHLYSYLFYVFKPDDDKETPRRSAPAHALLVGLLDSFNGPRRIGLH